MSRLPTILLTALLLASSLGAARVVPAPTSQPTSAPTQQWFTDLPTFVHANGARQWIVGHSSATCVTQQEAADQARRDAASQLRNVLRGTLPGALLRGEADTWIKNRVSRDLALGNLIVDRAVRKVHRPYADIWTAAVLVDASPDRLAPIARDYDAWRTGRTATIASTGFSLVGLSLAILGIYAVMNALTKGYFRGRLLASAGLALGLGTMFLIWLAKA
jgi:hypothetical protein